MISIKVARCPSVKLSEEEAKTILHEVLWIQNLDRERDRGIIQFAEALANALNIELDYSNEVGILTES